MAGLSLVIVIILFQRSSSSFTSNITGGEVCLGDVITFTCTHNPPEELLQWTITESGQISSVSSAQFSFSSGQPPPNEITLPNVVNGRAILVSTSPTVVSTLTLTATMQLDGATVLCRGISSMDNAVITLASQLPSPPQNVMVTIVENGTATVTVNIDWDPPVNNDGGAVDSYTVETSPAAEIATVRVTSGTTATLDLSYNERYVVNVTAVNCVGNSTPAMTDPVEFVNCSTPSTNPNITFEPYQSTTEGSVITYQCVRGFIPEGRVMSVCGGDGRWDPDPDQHNCSEVNCGAPALPMNSSVVSGPSNEYRNGSEVTFQCNEGLFPSNEITITCTSKERWSPDPAVIIVCGEEPVNCSRPNPPRGGFLDEVTSTTLLFGCNEGYSPQGTMTAVCVATDTWSPDPTQLECTQTNVDCGVPQPPSNGFVTEITSTMEGSEVSLTFQCNVTAVCSSDGRWSPDPGQQVCGFQSDSCTSQVTTVAVSSAVVCSVVFYIGGVVSTILIYLAITRCKKTRKQVTITSSGRSGDTTPAGMYDEIHTVTKPVKEQAAFKLQENVAYRPVKK